MERSNKEVALIIKQTIDFLKSRKISQQDIESRINYTSLSKAKNYEKYPQPIIEKKTRAELLELLFDEFSLRYDEVNETVQTRNGSGVALNLNSMMYYILHYYSFAREVVDRALVKVLNNRKVLIEYRIGESWEGSYNVVENYTFIDVTKTGYSTPVRKLLSLFSGTQKYGHSYLLGTYSTIKKDGYPAAGRVVLEKFTTESKVMEGMNLESDYRIVGYLKDNVYITTPISPKTLDSLTPRNFGIYHGLIGEYKFIFPLRSNKWQVSDMSLRSDLSALITFQGVTYRGTVLTINENSINLDFSKTDMDLPYMRKQVMNINVNIRRLSTDKIFTCSATSPFLHGHPSAFNAYLVESERYHEKFQNILKLQLFVGKPAELP